MGSLCTELAKLEHDALGHAGKAFGLFREWLGRQFAEMGCGARSDALAMQVLIWSQGVATLASAFHDESFVRAEVRRMEGWLHALALEEKRRCRSRSVRRKGARKQTAPEARIRNDH